MKDVFSKLNLFAAIGLVLIAVMFAVCAADSGHGWLAWLTTAPLLGMAVTANQVISSKGEDDEQEFPVLAAKHLYQGTLAFLNRTSGSGEGYLTDVINSGGNNFAGIVKSEVDNSAGSSGDLKASVYRTGRYLLTGSGFGQHHVGEKIYASDNYTVTASSSSNTLIGVCVGYVSATKIWVEIDTQPA